MIHGLQIFGKIPTAKLRHISRRKSRDWIQHDPLPVEIEFNLLYHQRIQQKHSTPNESFLVLGSCEFIWHVFSWHFMTCDMQLRIFGFEEVSCHLCTAASHATNQSSTHRARRDKTSSCSSVRHGWGENQGLRISKWCKENRGGFSRGAWMTRKMAASSMAWISLRRLYPTCCCNHIVNLPNHMWLSGCG